MNFTGISNITFVPLTILKKSTCIGSSVIISYLISLGITFWFFPSTLSSKTFDKKFSFSIKVLTFLAEIETFSF